MIEPGLGGGLATFLREHQQEILMAWEGARAPSRNDRASKGPAFGEQMPAWLDRIAQLAGELGSGRTALPARIG